MLVVQEVVARGLQSGLEALSPRERDVFVVHDIDLYCEMEGGFQDHIPNVPEKFDWLLDILDRIGDRHSHRIIKALCAKPRAPFEQADALCKEYDERRDFRWKCLERYLSGQGIQLDIEQASYRAGQ
jgi:hypothetical protein